MDKLFSRKYISDSKFSKRMNKTMMKTPISSKAFVALPTDRRTKYLQNRCSFMRGICTKKLERYLN